MTKVEYTPEAAKETEEMPDNTTITVLVVHVGHRKKIYK